MDEIIIKFICPICNKIHRIEMGQFEIMRLMSCYCGNSFKITNYYNKVQCEFIENNKAVESFENN